jgi:hypothetical protein
MLLVEKIWNFRGVDDAEVSWKRHKVKHHSKCIFAEDKSISMVHSKR